jgi:tripartite-type tricarboxylate transporter receptor subunit TctC
MAQSQQAVRGNVMQPTRLNLFAVAAVVLLSSTLPGPAQPGADYPTKPIKLILPAAAGGPTDVPARLASQILQTRLGQPVVIENRPGAGGALGARVVATAAPDGYTLLVGNTSVLSVIPAVSASAGYDPVKNFAPIVRMTESFQILVVNADSPWKTLGQFVDDAKTNPGKINYAHTGAGGLPHLVGELFMLRSGARMTGVPYRSGGESVTAVLAKAVDTTIEGIAITRSLILDGKLRALGGQSKTRTPLLADMPTMAEAGVLNAEANTFYGLVAPAGTPPGIIKKISDAMNQGLATEEMQKTITGLGSEAKPNTPEEFAAYIDAQNKIWIEVGKAAGVQVN